MHGQQNIKSIPKFSTVNPMVKDISSQEQNIKKHLFLDKGRIFLTGKNPNMSIIIIIIIIHTAVPNTHSCPQYT
jgi:hypothetical protein